MLRCKRGNRWRARRKKQGEDKWRLSATCEVRFHADCSSFKGIVKMFTKPFKIKSNNQLKGTERFVEFYKGFDDHWLSHWSSESFEVIVTICFPSSSFLDSFHLCFSLYYFINLLHKLLFRVSFRVSHHRAVVRLTPTYPVWLSSLSYHRVRVIVSFITLVVS